MRTSLTIALLLAALPSVAHADDGSGSWPWPVVPPPPAPVSASNAPAAAPPPGARNLGTDLVDDGHHEEAVGVLAILLGAGAGAAGVVETLRYAFACFDGSCSSSENDVQTVGSLLLVAGAITLPYGIYAVAKGSAQVREGEKIAPIAWALAQDDAPHGAAQGANAPLAAALRQSLEQESKDARSRGTVEILMGFGCVAGGGVALALLSNDKALGWIGAAAIPTGLALVGIGAGNQSAALRMQSFLVTPTFDHDGHVGAAVSRAGAF